MKKLSNMKIAAKLLSGFIVVAMVAGLVGAVGIYNIKTLDNSDTELYQEYAVPLMKLGELSTAFQRLRINTRDMILANDADTIQANVSEIQKRRLEIDVSAKEFSDAANMDADTKAAYETFVAAEDSYNAELDKIIALSRLNKDEEAWVLMAADGVAGIAAINEQEAIQSMMDLLTDAAKAKSDSNTVAANRASLMMLIVIACGIILSIALGIFFSNIIGKPIKYLARMADKLAEGNVDVDVRAKTTDEIGQLMGSFGKMVSNIQGQAAAGTRIAGGDLSVEVVPRSENDVLAISMAAIIKTLRELVAESATLTNAAVEGRLDIRGDADKFEGGFKDIVVGVNQTLDAVIEPLNVAAGYVDRISKGDIPNKITDTYYGDFNEIKNNLNTCIDAVNALVSDAAMLEMAAVEGRLDIRAEALKHGGDFGKIVGGVNQTLDTLVGYIDEMPAPVMIIDREFTIQYMNNAGADVIGKRREELIGSKCYDGFKTSHCGTEQCACATAMKKDCKISSETEAHPGGLDLEISYTGIPIRNSENKVIGAIELVVDQTEIKKASRIAEKQAEFQKQEVEKLVGNLEKIAVGDLDVRLHVEETDEDTAMIGQNFMKINDSLTQSIEAIKVMMDDVDKLAQAAVDGHLSTRAAEEQHRGEYRKIVEGVNKILDAVIEPINEASAVLQEMAKGNLSISVQGDYKGDHAVIKNALNDTIETISSYIREISAVLTNMSDGNLQQSITADYRGDFVEIKDSLNNIIGSLNEVLGDINEAADQVASGSRQVSDGSQALSQGATEQASSIQQLTASITEIASQTKQNATNANQANELAALAKRDAVDGNEQMHEMVESMTEISNSSMNISKIIKVIDDIAFQTNILALNAAVEAARAGQHGKGFAVVAEEVRNLAARSANAAKETTDLIEGSIEKVQAGTRIATNTAEALNKIVGGVDKVANLVGEIAAASNEQAGGISQINKGIEQVSQVVQTNSATAEESAAASEELSGQADLLKQQVSRFKLKRLHKLEMAAGGRMLLENSGYGHIPTDAERAGTVGKRKVRESIAAERPRIVLSAEEFDKY